MASRRCRWPAATATWPSSSGSSTAGADPNASLPGGETALMTAARTGRVEVVRALIARGADVHATEGRRGQTALMWAAAEGHVETVEALIDAGADFQTPLDSGFTPLLFAVREGKIGVVRALLKAGANVNETVKAPPSRSQPLPGGRGIDPRFQRLAGRGLERALRAGGGTAEGGRGSERRPARLHRAPRPGESPQVGRRRQRSVSRGVGRDDQSRARQTAQGAMAPT